MLKISKQIVDCFKKGGKLLVMGNGGSATLSQHLVGELVCSFEVKNRLPLPAIDLTSNAAIITAWANDVGFEWIFARHIRALAKKGDVVVGFSTSGKSKNILNGYAMAQQLHVDIIDWPRKGHCTADIQDYQQKLIHKVCRDIDKSFK